MKKNEESANALFPTLVKLLINSAAGIIIALLLSMLFSVFILTELLPQEFTSYAAFVAMFIGSFASSLVSCRKLGKPILTALSQSLISLILLFLIGALLYGRFIPDTLPLGIIISCLLASLLGAIFSASGKKKKRSKKK